MPVSVWGRFADEPQIAPISIRTRIVAARLHNRTRTPRANDLRNRVQEYEAQPEDKLEGEDRMIGKLQWCLYCTQSAAKNWSQANANHMQKSY